MAAWGFHPHAAFVCLQGPDLYSTWFFCLRAVGPEQVSTTEGGRLREKGKRNGIERFHNLWSPPFILNGA